MGGFFRFGFNIDSLKNDSLSWKAEVKFFGSTAQKMKFFIKDFLSKLLQETADLVTFTEEIFRGKLHFLCNVHYTSLNKLTLNH